MIYEQDKITDLDDRFLFRLCGGDVCGHREFRIDKRGEYTLKFKIISVDSENRPAILLYLNQYKGKLFLNDIPFEVPKKKRVFYSFYEDEIPKREFTFKVNCESGRLSFGIGSYGLAPCPSAQGLIELRKVFCTSAGGSGCGFRLETIGDKKFRLFCNDADRDDDFNDMILDLEIID